MNERHLEPGPVAPESDQRKEWVEPTVTQIAAGSAELTVGSTFDNADYS
jgi:hypothetical protein